MIRIASHRSRGQSRLGHVDNMAATSDTPSTVSPEWETDSVTLKEFSSKKTFPTYAKIVKGSYMNIGSSKFSLQRQHQEVFIHSIKMGVKVLAHCVRRIDTTQTRRGFPCTRLQTLDQRLAIPVSYQGWFELLSEDGKSAKPYTSVPELAKTFPEKCLVRENVKAYLASSEGKHTFDKTRIVPAGEQLTLCGEVSLPSPAHNKRVKLLKCTDSKGESLYLSFDQKGIFTPIAGPDEFTGVFTIRDIIRRFRLPLTVKLIQGVKPKVDSSRFTGLIRLDWVYTDETAFVCPLEKTHVRMLPVPTDINLMISKAKNQSDIKDTEAFRTLLTKCNRMVSNYNNTIHLIVSLPDSVVKNKNRSSSNVFSVPQRFDNKETRSSLRRSKSKEDMLMDEIDDLYQFVRDGGPAPKSKFTYDSDEESYWEEPAYEPIDQFRARLMALEAGKPFTHHEKYKPTDPAKLHLDNDPDVGASGGPIYGQLTNGGSDSSSTPSAPPPLPRRSLSAAVEGVEVDQKKGSPPPLPPRQYVRSNSISVVHSASSAGVSQAARSGSSAEKSKKQSKMKKSPSKDSKDSNSSSSGGHRKSLGRDFRDSDISSRTRGSSGEQGHTKNMRKRMQTLYL
ncbi:uncharacterized protein LOC124276340 [Haliotis rubra]|uniref:uncharacterized protein LOC124276340 n=1 Tax=Haliotis rubra TaxID=36100 RepID=UPI001EE50CF5|nr:uncharacterized protein LOC124276340 [Haliotis rubra]